MFLSCFDFGINQERSWDKENTSQTFDELFRGSPINKVICNNIIAIVKGIMLRADGQSEALSEEIRQAQQAKERPASGWEDNQGVWTIGRNVWVPSTLAVQRTKISI